MNTPDYTEKLMSLANKELFGDEKMQLEKEINDNPALAEEYKKHLLAQELLESFIAQDLKRKLNAISEQEKESSVPVIKKLIPNRYKLAIAASMVLVLSVSSYLFIGNKYSYQNIADGYSLEIQEVRGTNLLAEDIIEKASVYISKNENAMAISILNNISPEDDRYFMAQLLMGKASYQDDLISKAVIAFQICTKANQMDIQLEGQYGFILCQLKLDSWSDKNQETLEKLSENENFKYKEDASKLLKHLSIAKFFN